MNSLSKTLVCAALLVSLCVLPAVPEGHAGSPSSKIVLNQSLPQMDGSHLTVKLVEVNYPLRRAQLPTAILAR
jgi:hypothetical protein